jgi:Mrp family chromosome partitioning ATPase/capsular polysaccharide biosynthesis protein
MKAALYLWKRRLRWTVLLSVILAVAMGIYVYYILPARYEAVAEVLMLKTDGESLDALADESIRWSGYDALKAGTLTDADWEKASTRVQRYGKTGILLVKGRSADAAIAAEAANALADSLITVINKSMNQTVLKSVVRAGVPETPIILYRELLIAAVFLGSFLLFSLVSLLICVKRPKLIRSSDIADVAGMPVLAELPDLRGVTDAFERFDPAERPLLYDFAGFYTHEQLRLISIAVRFRAKQDKLQSLAAVSRTDEEFRSELLVMLAQELCRQGSRVLLIDMNWYAPRLGLLLQAQGDHDLIHCLASNLPFEQAIVQTKMRNLYFIDQNHSQSMAALLSASASFSAFLETMYTKFDFLLFDMPEADLFTDALAIGGVLHGVLPVVMAKRWTPDQLRHWIDPMRELERVAPGLVITDASSKKARAHRKLERIR